MDFLWFFVSTGIVVECLRRLYFYCYPAKPANPKHRGNADDLTSPLLNEHGKCPFGCCAPVPEAYDLEAGASGSSDSEDFDEITSSEEIEELSDSLVDKRKGKNRVNDDGEQEIIGTIYPGGPGVPKLVHFNMSDNYFKATDNAGPQVLRKEGSAKIHPQPLNGTAEEADAAVAVNASKDDIKQYVTSAPLSDEYKLMPPVHEVVQHGNIPEGDEIQPVEGQCSYQAD